MTNKNNEQTKTNKSWKRFVFHAIIGISFVTVVKRLYDADIMWQTVTFATGCICAEYLDDYINKKVPKGGFILKIVIAFVTIVFTQP